MRLGVDVGTVRVGVARTDPQGILSIPVDTLRRANDGREIQRIVDLAEEFQAIEIVVGLPRHLKGGEGVSAKEARRYARKIASRLPYTRVCLVDERLTSQQAHERLRACGRSEKDHRSVIDQVAAQIILEQALEIERCSGKLPGSTIDLQE
ncbi:MAG: Holliday junction resolvase RuvX [Actinobacteria bacterium]|nr:MAG: Holliday junction resolvase RuvX [Actinomycetota bacterium]